MKDFQLEICCEGVESALNAFKGGCDRIELCDNLLQGGTTPSAGMIKYLRQQTQKGIFVLIRPRPGDFLYSNAEKEVMLRDIEQAKKLGADGIVCGALKADGSIDERTTNRLIEAALPLPFTFHRAFDHCIKPMDGLEIIIRLGAKRLLTSGQQSTAVEGKELIKKLIENAGSRICIMPGSGINSGNIAELAEYTGAIEFHASARHSRNSAMMHRIEHPRMSSFNKNLINDFEIRETNPEEVRKIREKLESA